MAGPAWMSWSSGKDSTFALHLAGTELGLDVRKLLVTINTDADRVAMHAVRRSLLDAQAESLGLPLQIVEIPAGCSAELYESRMAAAVAMAKSNDITSIIFGDLFLEDVRAYRERNLAITGLRPVFPLWGRPTDQLAREMLATGVRAVVTCVDAAQLPGEFVGRSFDEAFLATLPAHVDPCGERGEFHTFVWDGPGFSSPVPIEVGETVARDGFVFCDVQRPD